ncbi:MAG: hypothetical protein OEW21_19615 [Betaproteobacteria bacterium]|nr:hypothetical protein [Betaproteobacteria bacterium]
MRNRGAITFAMLGLGTLAALLALGWANLALAQGGPPNRDVRVVNTPAEPVPVKSAARKPWQASLQLDLAEGESSRLVSLPAPSTGKRIVIEWGSAQLLVLRSQVPYIQFIVSMTGNDPSVGHGFALTNVGAYSEGQYVWQSSHMLRLTAAQGMVRVLRAGGSNGPFFASLSLAGYEEDNE